MSKPKTSYYLIILMIIVIFSCKKENKTIENYPYANQMDTIRHNGIIRTFLLHVPASYSANNKTALVLGLHGYTGTARDFESWTHLSDKADAEGFIIVYPNGLKYPWTSSNPQAWNAGGPYEGWTQGTDDVGFIDQMIELICKYYSIDRNRIYVTGQSNGAFMSYRLGYELSGKIAAIAPHSGQMIEQPTKAPSNKVSILHLHALDDGAVPYFGGVNGQLVYSPVDTVLCNWASWVSCKRQPDTTFRNSDYLIKEWTCSGNVAIKSYVLNKSGHTWFSTSNSCIQANNIIWEFFKTHPKNAN